MKKALLSALFLSSASLLQLPAQVAQKLVIEEFTGAWCGYCPDGALIVEDIVSTNPDVMAVSVHNSDAMVTSAGNAVDAFFNSLGYPSAVMNRSTASIGRSSWASQAASMTGGTSNLSVSFGSWTYDGATGEITVTVNVESFGAFTGNKRLGLILTEDLVTGTGTGYNQTNYYNTTSGHPYYGAGNPIVGFEHMHVARAYLGGSWGQSAVLPYSMSAGYTTSYTFTTTLNSAWNPDNMHVIAYAAYYLGTGMTDRMILNAETMPMSMVTAVDAPAASSELYLTASPNPFQERTHATFNLDRSGLVKVEVLNTLGQQVAVLSEGMMTAGTHTETWISGDAPAGIYFIRVTSDAGESRSTKVVLSR
jgi:hypothetical protein